MKKGDIDEDGTKSQTKRPKLVLEAGIFPP